MVKFITPARYDHALAEKGISVTVEENGVVYGTFGIKCWDPYSPFFKIAVERYQRVHKLAIKVMKEDHVKLIHQFVHMAMFDWEGIDGPNGPVPFTKDDAFEFLTTTEVGLYVFSELLAQARDIDNFKAIPEEDLVEAPAEDPDAVDPMASADEIAKN